MCAAYIYLETKLPVLYVTLSTFVAPNGVFLNVPNIFNVFNGKMPVPLHSVIASLKPIFTTTKSHQHKSILIISNGPGKIQEKVLK